MIRTPANLFHECEKYAKDGTGRPGSSCEMIILHNNSRGGILGVCMRIFTTTLRNKTIRQILNKNTSPYLITQRITCYLTVYFDEKNPF